MACHIRSRAERPAVRRAALSAPARGPRRAERRGSGRAGADARARRACRAGGAARRPRSRLPLGRRQLPPALLVHGAPCALSAADRQLRRGLGRRPAADARACVAREPRDRRSRAQRIGGGTGSASGRGEVEAARRRVSCRTSRERRAPSIAKTAMPAAAQRAPATPIASAAGPATVSPIGMKTNEPSASYELTRASTSSGICSCIVVIQLTLKISSPKPAIAATAMTIGSPAGIASAARKSGVAPRRMTLVKSGRSGRQRSATRLPTTRPTASPATTPPQPAAPPSDSFATTGPSTAWPPTQTRFPTDAATTTVQSHVREELLPPLHQLADEAPLPGSERATHAHPREDRGTREVGCRVERDRPPGTDRCHQRARSEGAEDVRRVLREAEQRVGLLELSGCDRVRHDAGGRGEEERRRDAANDLQCDQVPKLRAVEQQQASDHALRCTADDVGGDDDEVAGQTVGPDAPDEDEDDLRRPAGREHEAEVRGRTEIEYREGESDGRHGGAGERDELSGKEEPELPLAKRTEAAPEVHHKDEPLAGGAALLRRSLCARRSAKPFNYTIGHAREARLPGFPAQSAQHFARNGLRPVRGAFPAVPTLRLDQRADPRAEAIVKLAPRVPQAQPVDVLELRIVADLDDAPEEGQLAVPARAVHHRQRDARIAAHVLQAQARRIHVDEQ